MQDKKFIVDGTPQSFNYRIFVTRVLENNEEMIDAVRVLEEARAGDDVHLYINTPGGSVDSALLLYNALLNSRARTIGHCSGDVASAGTMLLMAVDEVDIAPFTRFLFHTSSSGFWGKSSETKEASDFNHRWNENLIRGIYGSFFDEEEYESMLVNGKDIRLTDDEFLLKYAQYVEENTPKIITKETLNKLSKKELIELILGEKKLNVESGKIE